MRLFVALKISDDVRERIWEFVREAGRHFTAKWVEKENLHITLKFLGEVDESKIPEIENALARVSEKFSPFDISVEGAGWFGDDFPRVVWIGAKGGRELFELWSEVESELSKVGFPRETRGFVSHITFGRIKQRSQGSSALDFLKKRRDRKFGSFRAEGFSLFKSTLTPSGPIYTELRFFRFRS